MDVCCVGLRGVTIYFLLGKMTFIGNFKAYQDLLTWLQKCDFPVKLSQSSLLYVVGPVGVGKTHGVTEACKELGLTLQKIDTNDVGNFKEFYDIFHKMCASDITAQFGCVQKESIVFLIDELDAFIALDRTFLSCFQKLIDTNVLPHARVIITTNAFDPKKEMAGAHRINLFAPDEGDIISFLRKAFPDERMETLLRVAETCNGNLSYALRMLQAKDGGTESSQSNKMDKYATMSDLYIYPTVDIARRVFNEDVWIMPLRFHENLVSEWKCRKGSTVLKKQIYGSLMQSICTWDMMMSYFKGDDFTIPIELLSQSVCKIGRLERKKNAAPPKDEFARIFSHLSLEKKNMVALEQSSYLTDGLNSFHRHLYDTVINKKGKKKTFLSDK